jgi:hypothetical protein
MRRVLFFLFSVLLLTAAEASAQSDIPFEDEADDSFVQEFDLNKGSGNIDWLNGDVTAVGIGSAPRRAVSPAQARAMAVRAAVVTARRNLLEIIQGMRIDSSTTVRDSMVSDDLVENRMRGYLQNSRILDTAYMSDGSVVVTVGLSSRGRMTETVLPESIEGKSKSVPGSGSVARDEAVADAARVTGLVLDARGFDVTPAMSPRVVDEDGKEVYGYAFVSREFAVKQGIAAYAENLRKAVANPRVEGNPLIVKIAGVADKAKTTLVVSSNAANRIRNSARRYGYLKQCRVVIVVD